MQAKLNEQRAQIYEMEEELKKVRTAF
jgi:chromosome segregation ATPase